MMETGVRHDYGGMKAGYGGELCADGAVAAAAGV
jgi:hypothetical protein